MQKGGRKEDRYVVNYDKGIVLRKRQALTLLKGLKIKVNKEHQVHFVDVFKALIKRIFDFKHDKSCLGKSVHDFFHGLLSNSIWGHTRVSTTCGISWPTRSTSVPKKSRS